MFLHPLSVNDDGLAGVTDGLNPEIITAAYRWGIFPWFNKENLFFWYFTSPRAVVIPENVKIHKSMRSIFNQRKFQLKVDTAFEQVINECAERRRSDEESWISKAFITAYTQLYHQGIAHSFEAWEGDNLVGGLYGLSLGRIFYGESMFSIKSNSSKFAFICLARYLELKGFHVIDCQQDTKHLQSLGSQLMSDTAFYRILKKNLFCDDFQNKWTEDIILNYNKIVNLG